MENLLSLRSQIDKNVNDNLKFIVDNLLITSDEGASKINSKLT